MGKMAEKSASRNQGNESEPVRKSTRMRKRRVLDGEFDEEDMEIRYLANLKNAKAAAAAANKDIDDSSSTKDQQNSMVYKNGKQELNSNSSKDGKKISKSKRGSDSTDYEDEEENVLSSESEQGSTKKMTKKKEIKDSVESASESKRSFSLTTRQRALCGASEIEFPNGLPHAAPRKQKEKLSEVEQQQKKAEAAQRRKIQVEKAAMELEAEAIRKIRGQESGRMKRESKIKKRQEELAQEKADKAKSLESSTIRWVIGPTGTTVTFPEEIGLPSIFTTKPKGYPPPRESCAGPSCSNPYKYRDSKSNVPLCSLKCYKAVHAQMDAQSSS